MRPGKRVVLVLLLVMAILLILAFSNAFNTNGRPETWMQGLEEKLYQGNLVVMNTTILINNTKMLLNGSLVVNSSGRLIVRDSEIRFLQDYSQQFGAWVNGNGSMELENVRLVTGGKWLNMNYDASSEIRLVNVKGEGCCLPWHSASTLSGNPRITIINSTVGITFNGNVTVEAEGSSLFLELVFTNASGTFSLPKGNVKEFKIGIPNNEGFLMNISTRNCTFSQWGATLDRDSDLTFKDSYMTVGMNAGTKAGSPSPYVRVSGLKSGMYEDFQLAFDSNRLRLVRTEVTSWYPQAWNNATIEVSDSDLADVQWNGQDARVVVRQSNVLIAIARHNVTYMFYDSVIAQDVIAEENSRIYLYNTTVRGEVREADNGMVFVDGERLGKKP
jgi:hypothetical protein